MTSIHFRELRRRLIPFYVAGNEPKPSVGWVSFIRQSLNMTLAQLGGRMGVSKQAVRGLEKREAEGSVTIKSLQEAAKAMNMKLVYAITPMTENIDQYLDDAARKAARNIVIRTHQTMKLEGQDIDSKFMETAIEELSSELKRTLDRSIWA